MHSSAFTFTVVCPPTTSLWNPCTEPFGMLSQLACRGGITQNNSHPSLACLHNQTVITLLITADLLVYNSFEFLAKY